MEKVLCIDDDLSLLRLYQEELADEGYKVVLAKEAWDKFRGTDQPGQQCC